MLRTNRKPRPAFTLVELLIGAAITVMIMTILAVCFQTSMSAMSAMRAQGDAADQLRALSAVMKADLKADRCLGLEGSGFVRNRGRRISDYGLDQQGATAANAVPTNGFFFVQSPASVNEGNDGSFDSFSNTNCRVWMTCLRTGGDDSKLFSTTVGGTTFTSEAAEVAYFLQPMGGVSNGFAGAGPVLFNLHRRQRLVATDAARQSALTPAVSPPLNDTEVISSFATLPGPVNVVNTLGTITTNRPAFPLPLTGGRTGDDIILSNVLSFEVKVMWRSNTFLPTPPASPRAFGLTNAAVGTFDTFNATTNNRSCDAPYDSLSAFGGSTFDSVNPGMAVRIQAMQIRIRLYDPKAKTARQSTIIVDL